MRALITAAVTLLAASGWAESTGRAGASGLNPALTCTLCHMPGAAVPTVSLEGPATLVAGETQPYRFVIRGGPGSTAGLTVAAQGAQLQVDPASTNTKLLGAELVNSVAAPMSNGEITYTFQVQAPASPGMVRLFAAGLSGNGMGVEGDSQALAQLDITVQGTATPPPTAAAPVLLEPAAASAPPVLGASTQLSVVVDEADRPLRYVWTVAGPGKVTFSKNATVDAHTTEVEFEAEGVYRFVVDVKDERGIVLVSRLELEVQPPGDGADDRNIYGGCSTTPAGLAGVWALLALRRLRRRR